MDMRLRVHMFLFGEKFLVRFSGSPIRIIRRGVDPIYYIGGYRMLKLLLLGTAVTLLPGVIVLIIVLTVKKKKNSGQIGSETKKEPECSQDHRRDSKTDECEGDAHSGPVENGGKAPSFRTWNRGASQLCPVPDEGGNRRERTVMLTYSTLILKDKDHPLRTYKADLMRPVFIGREETCKIRLTDPSVSRQHLKVFKSGGLVYAENLSRANGTRVNGRYLTEPKEIVSGNLLELGNMQLLVEID